MINQKYKNKEITILSHDNPDVDSIISGFLMEKLLRSKGYKANYIIPDKIIDEESSALCLKYGIDPKNYQGIVPKNPTLFLVDHYKTTIDGKVIGIIDHHPTIEDIECETYINKPSSSTAMIIYCLDPSLFGIEDIKKVIIANFVDTNCFTSTKAIQTDKEWTLSICQDNGLDYEQLYKDGLCLTDISNLSKASIHGEKSYNYSGNKIKSSYIQVNNIDDNTLKKIVDILRQRLIDEGLNMWVFIIHDMKQLKSNAYLITKDTCEVINYNTITSRGTTIMPFIEKNCY